MARVSRDICDKGVQSHGRAVSKGGSIPRGRWRSRIPCKRPSFTTTFSSRNSETLRSGQSRPAGDSRSFKVAERERLINAAIVRITVSTEIIVTPGDVFIVRWTEGMSIVTKRLRSLRGVQGSLATILFHDCGKIE